MSSFIFYNAERRYAERRYAESRYAECRGAVSTSFKTSIVCLPFRIGLEIGSESTFQSHPN